MTRRSLLLLPCLAAFGLAGCVPVGKGGDQDARLMAKQGTCFAFVTPEAGETYSLTTGTGTGVFPAAGHARHGLDAAAVDAAFAREQRRMKINPKCLSIYQRGRVVTGG